MHKTKVSRAVQALENKRYLQRRELPDDRRHEVLSLTRSGVRVYGDLQTQARAFDAQMMANFSAAERDQMRQFLIRIAGL